MQPRTRPARYARDHANLAKTPPRLGNPEGTMTETTDPTEAGESAVALQVKNAEEIL